MSADRQRGTDDVSPIRRLDPRTVPRSLLLERLGSRRPNLSIVLVANSQNDVPRADIHSLRADDALRCQIVTVPGSAIDLVNRACNAGLAKLILVVPPHTTLAAASVRSAIDRLDAEHDLGLIESAGSLLVIGDLWRSLGGLDEDFASLPFALADFAMRARAIGFRTPRLSPGDQVVAQFAEDAARLDGRRGAYPDRSARILRSIADNLRLTGYTTITDRYDVLKYQPVSVLGDIDLVAFLDAETVEAHRDRNRGWRIVEFRSPATDPARASRYLKANAHLATDAEYSLWLDASVSIVFPLPLVRLVDLFLEDADMCVFRHHARRTIFEEAEACKERNLDSSEVIDAQMARYRREGVTDDLSLAEVPVILRRHTHAIRRFNEIWWSEILTGSRRDQLSFDYSVRKAGVACARFPSSLATYNGLFQKFQR